MSKLKEEELLYWLSQAKWYHPFSDQEERKSDQAYQQIKEMIQSCVEQEEIEVRYMEIILDLYDRLEKKKKPEMDEETANLQMALESFWTAWRETFGEGHKRKCYEDYLEIRARLQKLEVTEEWIEEKAKELMAKLTGIHPWDDIRFKEYAQDFIRSLLEEIQGK